jgi:hypothetical protein
MVASAYLHLGFVKREQCDLVHAHMPISGLICAILGWKMTKSPCKCAIAQR